MSNRYRNIISVRSNYLPQEFVPNFSQYAQILGNQQKLYDEAQSLRDLVPKHLTVDRPDVESYRTGISTRIDDLSNLYNTQGVLAGNRARSSLLRDVRRDWQPGGKAYGFQQNYEAYQNYIKQLDEYHKAGKITSDKRDALAQKSMQIFGKSYNNEVFKDFSGITAAEDVDLAKQADELAKGWAENKVREGQYTILNGQYFDMRTKTFVDPKEIYDQVFPQLMSNAKNAAYFNQEALLSGNKPQEIGENLAGQAALFAANKYGFAKYDDQYLQNWALRESIKKKNKMDLIDYENSLNAGTEETVAFTVDTGLKPMKFNGEKLDNGEGGKKVPGLLGITLYNKLTDTGGEKINSMEEYARSEQGKQDYPGLAEIIALPQFQRKRGKQGDPNWVESNIDYNKRIADAWESRREQLGTAVGKYSQFNSSQKKEAVAQVFGDGQTIGDINHKTIWLEKPGQGLMPVSYDKLLDLTGHKNVEELNKHSNVHGNLDANNGIHPSGFQAVVVGKNGKDRYNIVIGNTSIEHSRYNKPIFDLMQPAHDGLQEVSKPVIWQPAENLPPVILQSEARDIWNGDSYGGRDIQIYEIQPKEGYMYGGTDEQGNIITYDVDGKKSTNSELYKKVPASVTPAELIRANDNLNPYLPTRLNKKMQNE